MEPIKSISDADILRAYDKIYYTLETVGHVSKFNIKDNEASTALKRLL